MTKAYDKLKEEENLDRRLKEGIARGDSEKQLDALIEQYEPPKPAPEGIAL